MVATVLVLLSTQPLAAGPLAGNAWVMPVATLSECNILPTLRVTCHCQQPQMHVVCDEHDHGHV